MDDLVLFAGTANPDLANRTAASLGRPLGGCKIERFPDGELSVQLLEPVRRKDVFIIQPISPPVNDHLVELLMFADACRRAAAERITAVIPYMGYARSDKRHGRREPIAASMLADLFKTIGIDHVLAVALHAAQIEGFFHIPVDNLTAVPTLCEELRGKLAEGTVVVAPDAGAVHLAGEYAHRLNTSVVLLHKRRESGTSARVTHLVGEVRDRACLIVDDMISTGGTVAEAIEALLRAGARRDITIAATHGLFVQDAQRKLAIPGVHKVLVTDTVPVKQKAWVELHVVSVAPLIASALNRLVSHETFGDLY